ncbi:hypothetical protein [Sphingomonas sp.]|uniref:hypothetical protein n=1 Tax=Sphingomonas sp. TaxID=28214 RepID=UPI00286E8F99|nr:hypothetical protein [Sphingomonas sp.]
MIDEMFDRTYQAGRADLNAGIDRAVAAVSRTFRRELGKSMTMLHRLEWSAPWAARPAGRRQTDRARAA